MKKLFIIATALFCGTAHAASVDMQIQMIDNEIARLTVEKQQKYAELDKCAKSVNGFKIAGISLLGLTGVGIAVNISQAVTIDKLEGRISDANERIAEQNEIERLATGCRNTKGDWVAGANTCNCQLAGPGAYWDASYPACVIVETPAPARPVGELVETPVVEITVVTADECELEQTQECVMPDGSTGQQACVNSGRFDADGNMIGSMVWGECRATSAPVVTAVKECTADIPCTTSQIAQGVRNCDIATGKWRNVCFATKCINGAQPQNGTCPSVTPGQALCDSLNTNNFVGTELDISANWDTAKAAVMKYVDAQNNALGSGSAAIMGAEHYSQVPSSNSVRLELGDYCDKVFQFKKTAPAPKPAIVNAGAPGFGVLLPEPKKETVPQLKQGDPGFGVLLQPDSGNSATPWGGTMFQY